MLLTQQPRLGSPASQAGSGLASGHLDWGGCPHSQDREAAPCTTARVQCGWCSLSCEPGVWAPARQGCSCDRVLSFPDGQHCTRAVTARHWGIKHVLCDSSREEAGTAPPPGVTPMLVPVTAAKPALEASRLWAFSRNRNHTRKWRKGLPGEGDHRGSTFPKQPATGGPVGGHADEGQPARPEGGRAPSQEG